MSPGALRLNRLSRRLASSKALNVGPVRVQWRTQTGTPGNRRRQSSRGGEVWQDHEESIDAFIHYVSAGSTTFQRHTEVQSGDVILDFPGNVDLSGRTDLRFIVDKTGTVYVRKDVGRELAESWDLRCAGDAIMLTLLLRPQASPKDLPQTTPTEEGDTFLGETIDFQGEPVTFTYP